MRKTRRTRSYYEFRILRDFSLGQFLVNCESVKGEEEWVVSGGIDRNSGDWFTGSKGNGLVARAAPEETGGGGEGGG